MRDIAVLIFLLSCIVATLKMPWLGVLSLAVFSYMNPHAYAWSYMSTTPVYQILFLVACLALSISKAEDRQPLPKDWRIPVFFLLWFYFFLTTLNARMPDFAWPKLIEVSKIYAPFLLTLILINTREKLYYLIITIAGSIGLLAAKGGFWAITSGFSHRVYGPEGTQFYENNAFAIAVLITIPLLVLWLKETSDKRLRLALMATIPLAIASAISSWSRGALLTLGVLILVLLWHSKRKWLIIPLIAGAVAYGLANLPEEWFARMATIETYEEDASALSRLTVWTDGFNYALSHPFGGAGFEGWIYVTRADWHSSYVEIMAEHGLIAFALWISLLFGSIISLTRLPRKTAHRPDLAWVANYSYMVRASLIAYATGTIFLGLSYWDLFYHLVFIAVLIRQFALQELEQPAPESMDIKQAKQSRERGQFINHQVGPPPPFARHSDNGSMQ